MKLAIALVLLLIAPVTLASAYSYYGGGGASYVIALQWTTVNGVAHGQLSEVYIDARDPYQVQGFSQAFAGTQDGPDVSFIIAQASFLSSGTTWTGTLQGTTLRLTIPAANGTLSTLTLQSGSAQDYNRAAAHIEGAVAAAKNRHDQQVAVANANHDLEAAIANLQASIAALPRSVTKLSQDVADLKTKAQAMQRDYSQAMRGHYDKLLKAANATPLSCYELRVDINYDLNTTLHYDLNTTLAYDLNTNIAYDLKTNVPYDVAVYEHQVEAAKQAIDQIGMGFQRLQAAVAANASGTPAPEYDEASVKTIIHSANRQLAGSDLQAQALQGEAQSYQQAAQQVYQQGKALFARARAFVSSLSCTGE